MGELVQTQILTFLGNKIVQRANFGRIVDKIFSIRAKIGSERREDIG